MLLVNSFLKLMGNTVIGNGIVKPLLQTIYSLCFFIGLREVGGKFAKDLLLVCSRTFQLTIDLYVKCISFNFTVYIMYILDKWVPIL